MEIHHVGPVRCLPAAAFFSCVQIETGDPGLVSDRDTPAIRTESQRRTFSRGAFENSFATLPTPNDQPAILVVPDQKAAIRAKAKWQSFHVRGHVAGFQTLEFAVLRNSADADYAVLADAGI